MKKLLVLAVIAGLGYLAWQKIVSGGGAPPVIENPVYGEVRATATVQGREIEMALFIRAENALDCEVAARKSWVEGLKTCPNCTFQAIKCQENLPARYARLFDDVPIPSAYLSATRAVRSERDGRIVIYGLTDAEGVQVCEILRTELNKEYKGTTRCIPPSGG